MLGSAQLHLISVTNPSPGGGTSATVGPWAPTGNMTMGRYLHTQTLLKNGKVLVSGGGVFAGLVYSVSATAEIYDPTSRSFTSTGSMIVARAYSSATLLGNGKVLIAGGTSSAPNGSPSLGALASAELYDPTSGTFSSTGSMTAARMFPIATLLSNSTVLITGGVDSNGNILSSAEIYNPGTGTFTATASMSTSRYTQTATLLANGKVLVAAGQTINAGQVIDLNSAELYDPSNRTFTPTGSLVMGRETPVAQLLNNGNVLIAGGYQQPLGILMEAEVYDPVKGTFNPTGNMGTPRNLFSSALLGDGTVLVVGGVDGSTIQQSAEIYNPATNKFTATWMMSTPRVWTVTTALSDGSNLVAGGNGIQGVGDSLYSAEVYPSPTAAAIAVPAEFIVNNPVPLISSLSLSTAPSGAQVTINGANFVDGSEVLLNGKSVVAYGTPGTSTQAWIYPGYIGQYSVAVNNPTPGGGLSNTASLTVVVSVLVNPARALWTPGSVNQFVGQASGATDTSVRWSVLEGASGGTISVSGIYAAPTTPGTYHIVATSNADPTQSSTSTVQIGSGFGHMVSTGTMTANRGFHTTTLLPNGKVLFAGGGGISSQVTLNSAELYDPVLGTFSATGSMLASRSSFSATLLSDGKVLVAGGTSNPGGGFSTLNSAEIYDPATGNFSPTGNMIGPSTGHSAILLTTGQVLLVGGGANPQLYNPATGMFTATGAMNFARSGSMAVLLPNGKVLFAGGYYQLNPSAVAELYDPATGTFSATGSMSVPRVSAFPFHNDAVLLGNQKVLVVGGINTYTSAEIYDPVTGSFTRTPTPPAYQEYGFPLLLLPNGTAFMSAGTFLQGALFAAPQGMFYTEIYDPGTSQFFATPPTVDMFDDSSSATMLANGNVLIAGGGYLGTSADIYVPPASDPTGANPFVKQGGMPMTEFLPPHAR